MADNTAGETIRRYIVEKFPLAKKRGLNHTDSLLETGILDSMGVLELVEFIEGEFRISVTDEDLLPDNFQSIERIAAFVQQKTRAN